jgi:cytoskeletal protein CcmA (bactofilin family)
MAIKSWSTTAASNNSASPNGFPEGMAPSGVNDSARQVMADVRSWYQDAEWIDWGDSGISRASASTFKITGDVTSRYLANRRIRCNDASTLYGLITASSYSAPDTTVTVALDSGNLTTSLTAVAIGILSPTNRSIPPISELDTVTVSGAAQFKSTLTASGAAVFKTTLSVEGAGTISGAAVCKSTLSVEGAGTISGAAVLKSTLSVEGASTLSGAATFKSTVSIDSANLNRKGSDIASAGTTDLSTATGDFVDVTGTTTITALGTVTAGVERVVRFTGALTLTHNSTSLILPTSTNITTADGDTATFRSLGSGNWKCINYQRQDGTALAGTSLTAASQAQQETGSVTTVYVTPGRQQYHPSAAKAWLLMTVAGGTPTVLGSYNVSSLTDNGTGDFTANFTSAFSAANIYSGVGAVVLNTVGSITINTQDSASSARCRTFSGSTLTDLAASAAFFGDQ